MLRGDLYKPWFSSDEKWGFELISGDFKDVVVQIDSLELKKTESGNATLEYYVIHKPEILSDEDLKCDNFKVLIETVISDILEEAVKIYENSRNDNPTESSP